MKLFDPDSPFMQALAYVGNLVLLNLYFLLCCIPVVSIGASVTALYTVTIQESMGKSGAVTGRFFRAFRDNFRKATILWLILAAVAAALVLDYFILTRTTFPGSKVLSILFVIVALIYLPTLAFVFPLQARYENTVLKTLKNALALGIARLPQAVAMILLNALPLIILYFNQVFFLRVIPLWAVIACAATAQLNAYILRRTFRKLDAAP